MHTNVVVIFYTKQRETRLLLSLKLKSKQSQFLLQCTQLEGSNRVYSEKFKNFFNRKW